MKPLNFVGSSLDDLRNFPDEARRAAGFDLRAVQSGLEKQAGMILIWLANGTSRLEVIYERDNC